MTVDQLAKLLDAIARVLATVVWPALFLFVVLRFRDSIKAFFDSLGEISLKAAGIEASAKRAQVQAAATLAAADAKDERNSRSPQEAAREATDVVMESLTNRAVKKARRSKILWVDDRPESNDSERQALGALGIHVTTAQSTEQALEHLANHRFDLVISDMGRPPDERAGYTLLAEMQKRGIRLPFLIYSAGGNLPGHRSEALSRGAQGSTNRASELFKLIFATLGAS